jgi:uracil-DNA glycosylase
VFGEGNPGGIMFIGEGPGVTEEEQGRPFVGRSGQLLRAAIDKLQLDYYYITNIVACRACSQAFNSEGQEIYRTNRTTGEQFALMKDVPPTPLQMTACLPRLHEEIYLVDPLLIVTLGLEAAKALSAERITAIRSTRGKMKEAEVPGNWSTPSRTAKLQKWERKIKGEVVRPVAQNRVRYPLLPTYHPAYLLRLGGDQSPGNPVEMFAKDLKLAAMLYDRYMLEVYRVIPSEREITASDVLENI